MSANSGLAVEIAWNRGEAEPKPGNYSKRI